MHILSQDLQNLDQSNKGVTGFAGASVRKTGQWKGQKAVMMEGHTRKDKGNFYYPPVRPKGDNE